MAPPLYDKEPLSAPQSELLSREALYERIHRLQVLYKVGIALSAEKNRDRLMETILMEAKSLCHADGGTLYIREEDELKFAIMRTDSLNIALGGTTGSSIDLPPLPSASLRRSKMQPSNTKLVQSLVAALSA